MSDMSINKSMRAVIQWLWDGKTRSLIDPDPSKAHITFTTRFDATHSYFELSIPVRIKRTRTRQTRFKHIKHANEANNANQDDHDPSALLLRINASAVKTLSFASTTTADNDIHEKFSSRPSRITRIRLQTESNFEILVPVNAEEPLKPGRRLSGKIIDKVKQISNSADFDVYVSDGDLSIEDLQSISRACSQRLHQANDGKHDLKSLYGGKGAKVVSVSPQTGQPPPSYDEVTPPPPAPIVPSNQPKRRRQMSDDDLLAELARREKKMFDMMEDKIRAHKEEGELPRLEERVKRLEKENQHLRETIEGLVTRITNRDYDIDDIDKRTSKNQADVVTNDDELTEIRHEVGELKEKAEFIQKGELLEAVKNDVIDHIRKRLFE
jgi:soluble cytochrome b562